ncbi:Putative OmpA-like family protein [Candidatus Deianiraea vastatrix]|uniref:OmpA-like family protein n=2 Tax=Candidatus Deianiraea vastatrix TaxID=2163644 RepID=A0A5B8XDY9_9RICK|nr:Putative OmpA-like family protein [Candidatus Deianiraea vastatrix]
MLFMICGFAKNEHFQKGLASCYMRYAEAKNIDGNGTEYLKFKKRAYKVTRGDEIFPYSPLDLGVSVENGLDFKMDKYNRLMKILSDTDLIKNEYDMLAHLQCLFDCWIGDESQDALGKQKIKECEKSFLWNLESFEQKFKITPKDTPDSLKKPTYTEEIAMDEKKKHELCYSVYYNEGEYIPPITAKNIVEKIIKNTGSFDSASVLITGYIDWTGEPHYGRYLAKKRMIFMRDLLVESGVSSRKVLGFVTEYSDILKDKNDTDKLNARRRVRVCIVDFVVGSRHGQEFLDFFDYKGNGDLKPSEIEKMGRGQIPKQVKKK